MFLIQNNFCEFTTNLHIFKGLCFTKKLTQICYGEFNRYLYKAKYFPHAPYGQTKIEYKIYLCLGNLQRHMPLHDPTGNAKKKALELKVGR